MAIHQKNCMHNGTFSTNGMTLGRASKNMMSHNKEPDYQRTSCMKENTFCYNSTVDPLHKNNT